MINKKTLKIEMELEEVFNDPLLSWINPESCKKMNEVVRDVFPNLNDEGRCSMLSLMWEENDTPETLHRKLVDYKNA